MTIQHAITKAVEGGWLSEIAPNIEYVNEDLSGGIRHGYCELGFKQDGVGKNISYQRASMGTILLDPYFWRALGKSMGWEPSSQFCPRCGELRFEGIKCEDCGNRFIVDYTWALYWHRLIDHLAEGGTIESYFEKL